MLFRKALLAIGLLIAQAKSLEITVEDDGTSTLESKAPYPVSQTQKLTQGITSS
jgi:hypothetical protein